LFLTTVLLFLPFAFLDVDPHHQGIMLKSAMDVANGMVLFRDSFEQYGFLTAFFQAAALKLFGEELLVIQLLTVFFYGLCAVELDRFWSRFLSVPFRWLVLVLYWGLGPFYLMPMLPWSSVYALYFMLLGGTLTVRYLDRKDGRFLFGGGIAAGFAFGCRQPCGFVMVIAAFLTLGLEMWTRRYPFRSFLKKVGIWLGGALLVPLFLAVYLTIYRAWPDYLLQTFRFAAQFGLHKGCGGGPLQILTLFFPPNGFIVFPLLSLGLFFFCCHALFRRRNPGLFLPLAAATLVGLASWHQFYPVREWHYFWASVPMFGVVAYVLEQVGRTGWKRTGKVAVTAAVLILPGIGIGYRMYGAVLRLAYAPHQVRSDIPGMRGILMSPRVLDTYRHLFRLLRRIPEPFRDRACLNLTNHALFCCFFPVQPAIHPMYVNWQDKVYPGYDNFMMEFVRKNRPVIFSITPVPYPGYRPIGGVPANAPVYFLSIPPF